MVAQRAPGMPKGPRRIPGGRLHHLLGRVWLEKTNGKRWWRNGPLGCARGPGAFQEVAYSTCWGGFGWKKQMENDGGVTGPWDAQGAQAHCRRYTETCLQIALDVDTKRSDNHYKKNRILSFPTLAYAPGSEKNKYRF